MSDYGPEVHGIVVTRVLSLFLCLSLVMALFVYTVLDLKKHNAFAFQMCLEC